jgi:cytochrome c-type biogenesis protein CcsB
MTAFVALLAIAGSVYADDLDFSTLQYLAAQKDGRKKPLDTVAIGTVEKLTGKREFTDPESGRKMQPMDVLLSMWFQTRDWRKVPVVLVNYRPLREKLELPAGQKHFSYTQLATPKLQEMIERTAGEESGKQKVDLSHEEREAQTLHQRLTTLLGAVGLESLDVVPHPSDPKGAWKNLAQVGDIYGSARQEETQKLVQALGAAYVQRDPGAFAAASRELVKFLRGLSPTVYPSFEAMQREVHYNSFHPFRKAMGMYGIAFTVVLASFLFRGSGVPASGRTDRIAVGTPLPQRQGALYWVSMAAFVAGVAVHGYAFYLRIMISGRPPITNMYESVVWVSFGAALFALILESVSRQRYYIVSIAPISMAMLWLADQFPAVLDPSIGPLVPVLRDNFWLSVHVPTITLGYAAFAVAMAVGHVALGYYIFAPQAREKIARLESFVYRAMQIGVLLLAAGTILGGIWAHYAWGRFWGWDPKETWALIALLSYLVPLHGRIAGWMSGFALCVASVASFLAVLMAWYGVNFVLGRGLHSYGFGVGGFGYVLGFVAIELVYVACAALRRNQVNLPGVIPKAVSR